MQTIEGPMNGRTCVITGANSGIGLVTARELALKGATVVMVCRDPERGEAAKRDLRYSTRSDDIHLVTIDLASFDSVREGAAIIAGAWPRIDVLVLNAGQINDKRHVTVDGHEATFQVNHLSHFLLANLLREQLVAGSARVVAVSSDAHLYTQRLAVDDLDGKRKWGPFAAYAASKLENILYAFELSRRAFGTGVTVNAMHPGTVRTSFGAGGWGIGGVAWTLTRPFLRTPEQGADTAVWLASAPEVEGVTGGYFQDRKAKTPSPLACRRDLQGQVWRLSVEYTGSDWPESPQAAAGAGAPASCGTPTSTATTGTLTT
jgi:NAD(P)-dependent dehydrogenase (short-subunit alcohol dehydrogenase family)